MKSAHVFAMIDGKPVAAMQHAADVAARVIAMAFPEHAEEIEAGIESHRWWGAPGEEYEESAANAATSRPALETDAGREGHSGGRT